MTKDIYTTRIGISKEVEAINFRALRFGNSQLRNMKDGVITIETKGQIKPRTQRISIITSEKMMEMGEAINQLTVFESSMKLLTILGAVIGLNPVSSILKIGVGKKRFSMCYWRLLHAVLIGSLQAVSAVLCFYSLIENSLTAPGLGDVFFCLSTSATTFLFVRIGTEWPKLMKNIANCNLDEYINPWIKVKCYVACLVFFSLAIIEHVLYMTMMLLHLIECHPNEDIFEMYLKKQFSWFFVHNLNMICVPVGVFLQLLLISTTLTWSYSDVYIICVSMYLASILEQINKKVILASKKYYLSPIYWRTLRKDYYKATQLVHSFDNVFSGLVFTCFVSHLFFVCQQLYNILMNGVMSKRVYGCPNFDNGQLSGYAYTIYLLFSTSYLFIKSLAVSLVAASVNTASLAPAHALYSVPSSGYCEEVSRFITQVNGDKTALSGLQFFNVTRDLVVYMAGTIVTYVLVLLQFNAVKIVR